MASVDTTHEFLGTIDEVFSALTRYDLYPKYLQGVTNIETLPPQAKGSTAQVRYEVNLIKKFHYTLDMFEEKPSKIRWTLADSNLMKVSEGQWKLSAKGKDKTQGVYSMEVKFKGLIPGAITDQVAKANLPGMMQGFQRLISDLKAGSVK